MKWIKLMTIVFISCNVAACTGKKDGAGSKKQGSKTPKTANDTPKAATKPKRKTAKLPGDYEGRKALWLQDVESKVVSLKDFEADKKAFRDRVIKIKCSMAEGDGGFSLTDELASGGVQLIKLSSAGKRNPWYNFAMHNDDFKIGVYAGLPDLLPQGQVQAGPPVTVTVFVYPKPVTGGAIVYGRILAYEP